MAHLALSVVYLGSQEPPISPTCHVIYCVNLLKQIVRFLYIKFQKSLIDFGIYITEFRLALCTYYNCQEPGQQCLNCLPKYLQSYELYKSQLELHQSLFNMAHNGAGMNSSVVKQCGYSPTHPPLEVAVVNPIIEFCQPGTTKGLVGVLVELHRRRSTQLPMGITFLYQQVGVNFPKFKAQVKRWKQRESKELMRMQYQRKVPQQMDGIIIINEENTIIKQHIAEISRISSQFLLLIPQIK